MFWKKPVVLNLYTPQPAAYEFSQWKSANTVKPDWWKQIPNDFEKNNRPTSTMKGCAGLNDLFKTAFAIPMWSDFVFTFSGSDSDVPRWNYEFKDQDGFGNIHEQHQRGTYLPDKYWQHFKLGSPWFADCKDDVQFMMVNAGWHQENPLEFYTPTGIVNYKNQSTTDVNLMFPRNPVGDKTVLLEADTVIAYIVPLTERKVILKHHYADDAFLFKMVKSKHSQRNFVRGYYKDKKCPFRREK